jgi:hypothetical protein
LVKLPFSNSSYGANQKGEWDCFITKCQDRRPDLRQNLAVHHRSPSNSVFLLQHPELTLNSGYHSHLRNLCLSLAFQNQNRQDLVFRRRYAPPFRPLQDFNSVHVQELDNRLCS